MANAIGAGTFMRCAYHLANPASKSYEVNQVRSNTMPMSPFGTPLKYQFTPTVVLPFSRHAFNGEKVLTGEPGGFISECTSAAIRSQASRVCA